MNFDREKTASDAEEISLQTLQRADNILFVIALFVSGFFRWAIVLSLLFRLYVFVRMLRRDRAASQKVAMATVAYGVVALALAALFLLLPFCSKLH